MNDVWCISKKINKIKIIILIRVFLISKNFYLSHFILNKIDSQRITKIMIINEIQYFLQLLKSSLNTLLLKRTEEFLIGIVIKSVNEHTPREWQDSRSRGLACYRLKLFIYIPGIKNNRRAARNFIHYVLWQWSCCPDSSTSLILACQPNLRISEDSCLLDQALRYRIPASIFIFSADDINYYNISPWVVVKNLAFSTIASVRLLHLHRSFGRLHLLACPGK